MGKESPIYICPKCGDIYPDGYTDEARQKRECGCGLPLRNQIKTNYVGTIYNKMNKAQTKEWEEMLRKRYVLNPENPYYDKEAYYKREDRDFKFDLEMEERRRQPAPQQSTQPTLICPKCGSKNFTPVRRKWSFLTGFMTNKVDMVCTGCGWVKKG